MFFTKFGTGGLWSTIKVCRRQKYQFHISYGRIRVATCNYRLNSNLCRVISTEWIEQNRAKSFKLIWFQTNSTMRNIIYSKQNIFIWSFIAVQLRSTHYFVMFLLLIGWKKYYLLLKIARKLSLKWEKSPFLNFKIN